MYTIDCKQTIKSSTQLLHRHVPADEVSCRRLSSSAHVHDHLSGLTVERANVRSNVRRSRGGILEHAGAQTEGAQRVLPCIPVDAPGLKNAKIYHVTLSRWYVKPELSVHTNQKHVRCEFKRKLVQTSGG
eukprot:jgi/Ulvmu1/7340/UM035_0129.1